MSVDLSRLQELATPLKWEIQQRGNEYRMVNDCDSTIVTWSNSLSSICSRLEAEYSKLAEQDHHAGEVMQCLTKADAVKKRSYWELTFQGIADELAAMKELTLDKRKIGLYDKFVIERTDGTSAPGRKHDGCEYFVLDLTHDKFANPAIRAYRDACKDEYPVLAKDLTDRYINPDVEPQEPTQSYFYEIQKRARELNALLDLYAKIGKE